MLVPDMRVVPPPSLVERMPTEEMKYPLLTFSWLQILRVEERL
jgi:hypothetical protein